MLISFFIGLFCYLASIEGLKDTVILILEAIGIVIFILIAIYLIASDE